MLIPNKFNGYKRDGTRLLHIGGGVGEAALLNAMMTGAAVGGGSSIIQGKDPLQGALIGGLMGGAGGALFGSTGAAAGEAASGAMPGAQSAVLPEAISAQTGSNLGALNPDFNPLPGTAGAGAPGTSMLGSNPAVQYSINSMPATIPGAGAAGSESMFGRASQAFSELTPKQQLLAGGAGIAGLGMIGDQLRGGVPKKKPYSGALSQYRFDPSAYRPYSYADGGIASLGSYSDGGRMLKGPGDGMSDSIPASIGRKQPARLADGEFVVPADVVSHLGNGSTDAGAKQLYSMMNKVRHARTGNSKQGREIQPRKYLPA
jgi:hypothetical protein